ncbi:MAG: hypothetical protein H6581_21520 [Bacteroidia bacterium]|nr:hypothetical protein [Bacteroidia bacterium]
MPENLSSTQIVTPKSIDAAIARMNLKQARETWNMTNELADEQPFLFKFLLSVRDFYAEPSDFDYLLAVAMVAYDAFRRDNPEPVFVSAEVIARVQKETFDFFNSLKRNEGREEGEKRVAEFMRQSRQAPLLKFVFSHSMGNPDLPKPYQSSMFSMIKVMVDSLDRAS